ncbi:MAG: hypothetical protein H6Q10_1154, partial [Acidobacteria bacterium]|nr:hypothetical protein [Acidobacteriota bacterium]
MRLSARASEPWTSAALAASPSSRNVTAKRYGPGNSGSRAEASFSTAAWTAAVIRRSISARASGSAFDRSTACLTMAYC